MFKATPQNSPIFIIDGKPKVVRAKKLRRQPAYRGNSGCLFGLLFSITSSDIIGMLFLLFVATLLFIMIGISFVLWLLPLFLMKTWAFKRSPGPPGALPVFFLVLVLTILPGTLGLDGLNKQDGWNWFHLYENTVARIFPEHISPIVWCWAMELFQLGWPGWVTEYGCAILTGRLLMVTSGILADYLFLSHLANAAKLEGKSCDGATYNKTFWSR